MCPNQRYWASATAPQLRYYITNTQNQTLYQGQYSLLRHIHRYSSSIRSTNIRAANHWDSHSHSASPPGCRDTRGLITKRYVWPSINKDCIIWTKACFQCQRNKISHYMISPIITVQPPSHRFEHIRIDLVTLLLSKRQTKCLTKSTDSYSI